MTPVTEIVHVDEHVETYPRPADWPLRLGSDLTEREARALTDTLSYLFGQCGRPGAERLAWTDLPQLVLDDLIYDDVRAALYPTPVYP